MAESGITVKSKTGRPSWRRILLLSAALVAVVAVLFLACGFLLLLRVTPAPVVHTDPAIADKFAEELKLAEAAAGNGQPAVVRADETEINSILANYLDAAPADGSKPQATVRDMKLNLAGDQLRLYVRLNVQNRDLSLVLQGKLRTEDGYLRFEPESGKIGDLPIPRSWLRRTLNQMMENAESRQALRLPANLSDVQVRDGKVVVVYH